MLTSMKWCLSLLGAVLATGAIGASSLLAAPPPAVAQYVEQIPSATGSKAAATPSSQPVAGSPKRPVAGAPRVKGNGQGPQTPKGSAPAKGTSTTLEATARTPFAKALIADRNAKAGIGRGALLLLALGAATLIALGGLALRRRMAP